MARRRKVYRAINKVKFDNEETDGNNQNCFNGIGSNARSSQPINYINRNRVIFRNSRSYSSIFNNSLELNISNRRSLSSPTLINMNGKNYIKSYRKSASTQTSVVGLNETFLKQIRNTSTQTVELDDYLEDHENDYMKCRSPGNILKVEQNTLENYIRSNTAARNKETIKYDEEPTQRPLLLNQKENQMPSPSKIPIRVQFLSKANIYPTNTVETKTIKKKKRIFYVKKKHGIICCKFRKTKNILRDILKDESDIGFTLYGTLITMIKNLTIMTAEWSLRIFEIFTNLGVGLKKSLTCVYKTYEAQSTRSLPSPCKCSKYQHDIDRMNSKFVEIEKNLEDVNDKLIEYSTNNSRINELSQKLDNLSKDIDAFGTLKSELEELNNRINRNLTETQSLLPPLPPPPPPPPPPPVTMNSSPNKLARIVRNNNHLKNFENARPIITLEDILKVKLRKIAMSN